MRKPRKITLPDGTARWETRLPDAHGVARYARYDTKREAEAACTAHSAARRSGAPLVENARMDALLEEFARARSGKWTRASSNKDARASLARLGRHFGRTLLRSLTPEAVEKFRDAALAEIQSGHRAQLAEAVRKATLRRDAAIAAGTDPSAAERRLAAYAEAAKRIDAMGVRTANKSLGMLRRVLKFAEGRRMIAFNAAVHADMLPRKKKDQPLDHACLTPAEIQRLLAAADPDWRAMLGVLAYGGLRLGEALGLQWGDVEWARGRILVRRQLDAITRTFSSPKTEAGQRFVELPSFAMTELKAWRLRCPKGELDLCFPDHQGGPSDHRNFRSRQFHPALRRARLRRIRVHDLRHTAASLLIATGADLAAIARQLGHSNPAITLSIYTHAFNKRADVGLGARLETFVNAEGTAGCTEVVRAA